MRFFSYLFFLLIVPQVQFAQTQELYLPFPENLKSEVIDENSAEAPTNKETEKGTKEAEAKQNSQVNAETNPNLGMDPSTVDSSKTSGDVSKTTKKVSAKKKKKEAIDPTLASYKKGKSYLTRDQKKNAEEEFASSYKNEGEKANASKLENTNLFGLDGKEKESTGLVDSLEDPDLKTKSQFELARSLDRMGKPESEEKAYKEYLKLINDFPKHPTLTPRAHFAVAVLLIRRKEYRPSIHHLVSILKEYKDADEFIPAHYYLGKVYEGIWEERDLERSKKYYQMYNAAAEGKTLAPGYDFRKETKNRLKLLGGDT
ncbi:tetratricopeptide repeat protein [Leptospira sp. 96542]|nr:tetratricopeptide repeat protein [Leptospira sp. 96542]